MQGIHLYMAAGNAKDLTNAQPVSLSWSRRGAYMLNDLFGYIMEDESIVAYVVIFRISFDVLYDFQPLV